VIYACSVEYFGEAFHGWQTQKNTRSVQEEVEKALSKVANHSVSVQCSGRTDSGVHALNQVISFSSNAKRSERQWHCGVNANLPRDISIHWVVPTLDSFNARFCAERRHYRYVLFENNNRSALFENRVYWVREVLNISKMNEGAKYLFGEHDFSAFRSSQCQANHANRYIESIIVTRNDRFVYIDVIGNAFLQNMVRIITGALLEIGMGKQRPDWCKFLLDSKDRTLGARTAPAQGLYFLQPKYPNEFKLPNYSRYPEL
jgi:tRNA pseudouridine38-40 synthase